MPILPFNQDFWETARLVDPETPDGQLFQQILQTNLERMVGHIHDFSQDPVRIMITDDPQMNGRFLAKGEEGALANSVYLTSGLIKFAQNLDEIMGVLGHEFAHYGLDNDLGEHKNSMAEEWLSDSAPLEWMHHAGFSPVAVKNFMQRVNREMGTLYNNNLAIYLDVHGTFDNRLQSLDASLTRLDRQYGETSQTMTPIPDELRRIAENASHTSFYQAQEQAYQAMTTVEKLVFLRDEIPNLTNSARDYDYYQWLKEIKLSSPSPERDQETALFHDLYDAHLEKGNASNVFQIAQVALFGDRYTSYPIGKLRIFEQAVEGFVQAENAQQAHDYGSELIKQLKDFREKHPDVALTGVTWPTFPQCNDADDIGKPVPWQNFVDWAAQDSSDIIPIALNELGIYDERLLDTIKIDNLQKFNLTKKMANPFDLGFDKKDNKYFDYNKDGLIFADDQQPRIGQKFSQYLEQRHHDRISTVGPISSPESIYETMDGLNNLLINTQNYAVFDQTLHQMMDVHDQVMAQPALKNDPFVVSTLRNYLVFNYSRFMGRGHNIK
jgi:hypothetical protein